MHDFKLRMKCLVSGDASANSGVQYRAERRPDGHAAGYQADCDDGAVWFGRIYDEHGRGLLVERGAKVVIDEAGQRKASTFRDKDAYQAIVKEDDWNEYVIRAVGPRMQTWINGSLASELIDHPPSRAARCDHSAPSPSVR